MARTALKAFPYPVAGYDFSATALQKHWSRLHRGDCEPFPAPSALTKLVETCPKLAPSLTLDRAAEALQAAWRAFHRGDFQDAERRGLSIGKLGFNVANKAANIRATYLETAEKKKSAAFLETAHRAEELQRHAPSVPNAWYLYAQALGRYAQQISVMSALAEGTAGKVKASLEKTLELEPHHADAHIALGVYHAEVVDKIGGLVGRLTYGVSTDAAVKHFQKALKLNPDSAIARIEYARGLAMMFGNTKTAQMTRLYDQASKCTPADAMECLDIELARAQLPG